MEGDIQFAKQDYPSAFTSYDKVNKTILASPATFFSAAKTKELMQAPAEEVLALMDSCVARFTQPYTEEAAPYLLERAQARMNADQARNAMLDYDAYYNAVNGKVKVEHFGRLGGIVPDPDEIVDALKEKLIKK